MNRQSLLKFFYEAFLGLAIILAIVNAIITLVSIPTMIIVGAVLFYAQGGTIGVLCYIVLMTCAIVYIVTEIRHDRQYSKQYPYHSYLSY